MVSNEEHFMKFPGKALWFILIIFVLSTCSLVETKRGTLSVQLSNNNIILAVGEELTLVAAVTAENISRYNVTWSSSDRSKVTVDQNGKVTGIAPTTSRVTITATASASEGSSVISSYSHCYATVQNRRTYDGSVQQVAFTENTATVTFTGLYSNSIYLVKVNKSKDFVSAANTGSVRSAQTEPEDSGDSYPSEETLPAMGHPGASAFSANPPPIVHTTQRGMRSIASLEVGATRMFWVEKFYNSPEWIQKQALLMAAGRHGNIWVMDNKITSAQALLLAEKFDIIYPAVTNILGYEYGGGSGGDGGKDGDPKIQILVYDILDDSGDEAGIAGYFWSKDFYEQSQIDNYWNNDLRTNLAEIFYINAGTITRNPDWAYATLGHELQHMINFNMKTVKHGVNSEAWYNELLSAMTQDVIDASFLNIPLSNSNNNIRARIPVFQSKYNLVGVTEWDSSNNSYATATAFGAYLLRNYGGAELLQKILANDKTNIDSLSLALDEISPGTNFEKALLRFGEAMIFSGSLMPDGVNTFDKTVTVPINGFTYTAFGFDIWNGYGNLAVASPGTPMNMARHSLLIHHSEAWYNQSGNISVTLEKPNDPGIVFYLMVR